MDIYLDNAATTPLHPNVLERMMPFLTRHFGNPSSIYKYGREVKMAVEEARKTIADILHAKTGEIFFTSGGTESNNMALTAAVRDLGVQHIITSAIEHHAVKHTIEFLQKKYDIEISYVNLLPNGHVDLEHLEKLLANSNQTTLVSLMHANNEMGNLLPIEKVAQLTQHYKAYFHSDTVQTVGHYPFNLNELPIHFITGAAHKFNGPKGIGILYINQQIKINPLLHGGGQERNMRAGTENIYGIVGFAAALNRATATQAEETAHIKKLRQYMYEQLLANIPNVTFNGDVLGNSLYTILSVALPKTPKSEYVLFNLDMQGIYASGGSACSSGASTGSHVIHNLNQHPNTVPIRFSFGYQNTIDEVDKVVKVLQTLL